MSNDQLRRPNQLPSARSIAAVAPAVFRSPELFSSEQAEKITQLIAGAKLRGVVIGALIGSESWDLRPVVLDRGRTVVLRFSDPELYTDSVKQSSLEGYLARLGDVRGIDGFSSSGLMQSRVWFLRPYFAHTLDEEVNKLARPELVKTIAQDLIRQLAALHDSGLIHGHVCAANVGIDGNSGCLLDFGIASIRNSALIKTVETVNEDTRALAELLIALYQNNPPAELRPLLEKLLRSEVWDRPSLKDLLQSFEQRAPATIRSTNSGKIIDASTAANFQPPAVRVELAKPESAQNLESKQTEIDRPAEENTTAESKHKTDKVEQDKLHKELNLPKASLRNLDLMLIGLFLILAFFAVSRGYISLQRFSRPSLSINELESKWLSAQPSQMLDVARLAVLDSDADAQAVVVKAALTNAQLPGVRSDLIKISYDTRWEQELSSDDRKFVLSLALAGLLKNELPQLDALSNHHPAVIFSIAATLPLASAAPELDQIATQALAELPDPIGTGFNVLTRSGATQLASPAVRAFAVLAAASENAAAVRAMFPDNLDVLPMLLRINAVLPLCKQRPELAQMVRQAAAANPNLEAALRSWFADDEFGVWKGVSDLQVLSIAAGSLTGQQLVFQQLVDLVSYPLSSTREAAIAEISRTTVDESVLRVLDFLGHSAGELSRSSVLSLMTLLQLPSDQSRTFALRWFAQKPAPKVVLGILIARARVAQGDFFNFEAARYLDRAEELTPNLAELTALTMHTEVQARALAYGKLSINVPTERLLLEESLKRESNSNLKQLLAERLHS